LNWRAGDVGRSAAHIDEQKVSSVTVKRILLLVFILASSLTLPSFALAQSSAKAESTRTRRVKRQVLTSAYLPSIRVRFEKRFKYVGSQKFILYDRAQVEQHFFVDADNERRIKRMYMAQFEGYLPNINAKYDYPLTKTVDLGGQTYIANAESIPNVSAALKQNPQSDVARAASFLESKGYHVSESIMFQRFVRPVDEAERNEFILLYVEDAGAGTPSEKETAMQEFQSRALKGFTVLR
jgi:hypothetical protein